MAHEAEEKKKDNPENKFANNYWSKNQKYYDKFYTNNPNSNNNRNFNEFRYSNLNNVDQKAAKYLKFMFYFSIAFFVYMMVVANYRRKVAFYQLQGGYTGPPPNYSQANNPYVSQPTNQQPYQQQPYQQQQPYYHTHQPHNFQPVKQKMVSDDPYVNAQAQAQAADPYINARQPKFRG